MSSNANDAIARRRILLAGLVLLSFFGANVMLRRRPKANLDGCFSHTTRSTVVLLDYTDSIAKQTREEIESRAATWIADSVHESERVSVFTVTADSKASLVPVFSRCRPAQEGNVITSNTLKIKKEFQTSFKTPLSAALTMPLSDSRDSPIAQVIIDLSLSRYMRADTSALLVFSDLLEHDPGRFSLYTCADPGKVVTQFRASRTGMKERPEFRNLRVSLNIIPRAGASTTMLRCRDIFWAWFFGDDKGDASRLESSFLPGGALK